MKKPLFCLGRGKLVKVHYYIFEPPIIWMNGDDSDVRTLLHEPTTTALKALLGNAATWVIDEGQRIKNIGLCIKLVIGALWENFMVSERIKFLSYQRIYANQYFWRTHAQQEIDYIEERNGKMNAYEFKWNNKISAKISASFLRAYPEATATVIHPENMDKFLL